MSFPVGDFRSHDKDFQRVRNHNHKWARGGTTASGKPRCIHRRCTDLDGVDACADCWDKPAHRRLVWHCGRHSHVSGTNRASCKDYNSARKSSRRNINDPNSPSDSSAGEEDIEEASAAPEADAEVMYSFDATRSPGVGSQILSTAITKAVERFENQETEKLAREYEFVEGKDGYVADADEDDFEMIDDASMH